MTRRRFISSVFAASALTGDPRALRVPASVQTILAARIDRLAPGDKALLQAAVPLFREMGMRPWLAEAERELEALG